MNPACGQGRVVWVRWCVHRDTSGTGNSVILISGAVRLFPTEEGVLGWLVSSGQSSRGHEWFETVILYWRLIRLILKVLQVTCLRASCPCWRGRTIAVSSDKIGPVSRETPGCGYLRPLATFLELHLRYQPITLRGRRLIPEPIVARVWFWLWACKLWNTSYSAHLPFSGLARYILHIPATARSSATKFRSRVNNIYVRHLSEFHVDRWSGRVVIASTRYTIVEASPPSVSIFLLLPFKLSEVLLTAGILCHIITCASSQFLSFRSSEYSGFGSVTILVSVLWLFWFPFCDLQNFGHWEPFKVISFSVIENPSQSSWVYQKVVLTKR